MALGPHVRQPPPGSNKVVKQEEQDLDVSIVSQKLQFTGILCLVSIVVVVVVVFVVS